MFSGGSKKSIQNKLVKKTIMVCFIFSYILSQHFTQPAITCSKLTLETLEQDVKYVQS